MAAAEKYVNQAYLMVLESAANTITFSKLETGISIYEKVGWLISRLDYYIGINVASFAADSDILEYGITVLDSLTTLTQGQNSVVDYNRLNRVDLGTAATGMFIREPWTKNFADLPGGGLLVPPNPIYIAAKGTNMPNAMRVQARMFYTVVQLKAEDFWELVEQRRMIGV